MARLFEGFKIISSQVDAAELAVIMREFRRVLDRNTSGDVVEFGCFEGTASLFLQRELEKRTSEKTLHLYDSFQGLPEKTKEDASQVGVQFKEGELNASKRNLETNFKKANLELPEIHRGWFYEFTDKDVPQSISFAFLDGDFYESILDSLKLVWPRLSSGAVIVVDDYTSVALPGVKKAVDAWSKDHKFSIKVENSLAILKGNHD